MADQIVRKKPETIRRLARTKTIIPGLMLVHIPTENELFRVEFWIEWSETLSAYLATLVKRETLTQPKRAHYHPLVRRFEEKHADHLRRLVRAYLGITHTRGINKYDIVKIPDIAEIIA